MFGINNNFLKIRLKLETEFWPYWSPIHRYISTLHVMKQMNYFFVSLDFVCFLGLFLPIRIDTEISAKHYYFMNTIYTEWNQ